MSEPIPEAVPTSQDKGRRPFKRRALSPTSAQASAVSQLFLRPDRVIALNSAGSDGIARGTGTPEIVANVQGSSAGAGSGEFHVYKAARRREYERIARMEADADAEVKDAEHAKRQAEIKRADEERARKRRNKRRGKGRAKTKTLSDDAPGKAVDGDDTPPTAETTGELAKPGVAIVSEVSMTIHDDD